MSVRHKVPLEAEDYVRVWHIVLSQWLHWSNRRIETFIERWVDSAQPETGNSFFYHDEPFTYLCYVVLSPETRRRFQGAERAKLIHKMEFAVIDGDSIAQFLPGYDWDAAKRRVEDVLANHGGALASPQDLAWYEEELKDT